ncbi:hypothetical protein HG530_000760 [Fusarium avenaceum]|nr:hypothetical protein HG530_000760 [Fusarium avenaceum]
MAKQTNFFFPSLIFFFSHATPTLNVEVSNGDGLDVLVLGHTIQTALLSITALLDTTKWCLGSTDLAGVGADHADLHLVSNAHHTADVLGEEVSSETKLGVVGKTDRVLLGIELEDGGQRSEGLVLGDGHLLCDAGEDCGLVEESRAVGGGAASGDLGTLGGGIGDVLLHLVDGGLVDKRTLGGGLVETTAHLEGVDFLN